MVWTKTGRFLAALLLLAGTAGANAQSAGDNGGHATRQKARAGSDAGGTETKGTGVRTGSGPLSQPIPPAVSTTNPGQNLQQYPQRPSNAPGPALTNPPQQPFGSR